VAVSRLWRSHARLSLVLLALTGAAAITHAQTIVAGKMADQFNVGSGGGVNYRIPVPVPPGTAGMQPELQIAYTGGNSTGLAGIGWTLSGLQSIGRCPRTMGQDGVRGAVKFDDNDRYCLNGEKLMLVSGTYGQPGAEYRTEIDHFTKVVSLGRAGAGPLSFKVWTKSGRILEFGNTEDSRIEVVAAPGVTAPWPAGTVREWAVNKITDQSGNAMTVLYDEDAVNGVYRPNRIDYGANGNTGAANHSYVTFTYVALSNPIAKFRAGAISKPVSRLADITTGSGGTAHQVKLTFQTVGATSAPRLASVQLCDGATQCLPATTFTYQAQNNNFASTSADWKLPENSAESAPQRQRKTVELTDQTEYGTWETSVRRNITTDRLIDLNGDGLPDFYYTYYTTWNVYGQRFGEQKLWLNTGNGFSPTQTAWPLPAAVRAQHDTVYHQIYGVTRTVSQLVDLNGDGLPDAYLTRGPWGTASERSVVYFNTGSGFSTTGTQWALPSAIVTPSEVQGDYVTSAIVDMDGDGLPDVFSTPFYPAGSGVVYLNTGSGFSQTAMPWTLPALSWMAGSGPPQSVSWSAASTDQYPGYPRSHVLASLVDLNGDGLPDYYVTPLDGAQPGKAYLNTGVGFQQTATPWAIPNGWYLHGYPNIQSDVVAERTLRQLVDLNGDGLPDAYYTSGSPFPGGRIAWVSFNTGNGFGTAEPWPVPVSEDPFSNVGTTSIALVDLDGDGLADFYRGYAFPNPAYMNLSVPPAQLTKIEGTTLPTTTVTYAKLTSPAVYTKDTGPNAAVSPTVDLAGARTVVSSVATDNGIGGSNVTSYKYGGLKMERGTGRGMLGFRWHSATDNVTGVERYSEYRQDFPYTGMPVKSELRRAGSGNAGVLKRTEHTVGCQNHAMAACTVAAGSRYFPYVASTTENSWDLNGAQFFGKTTTTTYGQNPQYGAPTQTSVSHGDGVTQTTTHEYWPVDTSNWIINRVKRSVVTSTKP